MHRHTCAPLCGVMHLLSSVDEDVMECAIEWCVSVSAGLCTVNIRRRLGDVIPALGMSEDVSRVVRCDRGIGHYELPCVVEHGPQRRDGSQCDHHRARGPASDVTVTLSSASVSAQSSCVSWGRPHRMCEMHMGKRAARSSLWGRAMAAAGPLGLSDRPPSSSAPIDHHCIPLV